MTVIAFPSVQLDSVAEDTLDATQASITGSAAEPYDLGVSGGDVDIDVDGSGAQTVSLTEEFFEDLANASLDEIVAAVNSQLTGAVASNAGGFLSITSDIHGSTSSIEVTSGTIQTELGLPTALTAGVDATSQTLLVNRVPGPSEKGALPDTDLDFDLVGSNGTAPVASSIDVYVNGVLAVSAGSFVNSYTGSITNPFAGTRRVNIDPPVDYGSTELVTVRVVFSGSPALDTTYTFIASDSTPPLVLSAQAIGEKTVRVTFDEDIRQVSASNTDDALNPANYVFEILVRPAVAVSAVAVSAVDTNVVDITTDIELTYGAFYMLVVANGTVADTAGNTFIAPANTAQFVAFTPNFPLGRRFRLWDWIPSINKNEDKTRELEVFIAVLQEVANLLLVSVDRWTDILDPDKAPEDILDAILYDLGNPFTSFELSEIDKRRLINILVAIYKSKGTAVGIIDVVRFFLGIEVSIEVFNGQGWELTTYVEDVKPRLVLTCCACDLDTVTIEPQTPLIQTIPNVSGDGITLSLAKIAGSNLFDLDLPNNVTSGTPDSIIQASLLVEEDCQIAAFSIPRLTSTDSGGETVAISLDDNKALVVFVFLNSDDQSFDAVTFNGAAMTLLDSITASDGVNDTGMYVYAVNDVEGITGDLVVDPSALSGTDPAYGFIAVKLSANVVNNVSLVTASSAISITDIVVADVSDPYEDGNGDQLSASSTLADIPAALGPSTYGIYSFRVASPIDLTDEQRSRITALAEYMKPAHTHLISVQDPASVSALEQLVASTEQGLFELGVGPGLESSETSSALDFSTAAVLLRADFGVQIDGSTKVTSLRNMGTLAGTVAPTAGDGPLWSPTSNPANSPALFFDSSNGENLFTTGVIVNAPVTIFAVFRADDVSNSTIFDGSAADQRRLFLSGSDVAMKTGSLELSVVAPSVGTWIVAACVFNTPTEQSMLRLSTGVEDAGLLDESSGTGFVLGGRAVAPPQIPFLDGAIAHYSMFFSALTSAEVDSGIMQLAEQYNIAVS